MGVESFWLLQIGVASVYIFKYMHSYVQSIPSWALNPRIPWSINACKREARQRVLTLLACKGFESTRRGSREREELRDSWGGNRKITPICYAHSRTHTQLEPIFLLRKTRNVIGAREKSVAHWPRILTAEFRFGSLRPSVYSTSQDGLF